MVDAHPALKASSPQAPAIDMFLGDDFHHNGAFRLMYTFSWLAGNARPRAGATETRGGGFDYGTPDGYRFFLDAGPVANINEKYFNYSVPTWNEYMEHPDYDEYWERQNPLKHLRGVSHAVLNVAGWFDAEDFYGPLETYRAVERLNPANQNTIVDRPVAARRLGVDAGRRARRHPVRIADRRVLSTADRVPVLPAPPEGQGAAPGGPRRSSSRPAATRGRRSTPGRREAPPIACSISRRAANSRSRRRRQSRTSFDEYVSDPAKPVPWSAETRTTQGHLWMIEDQRFAAARPDVLVYQTSAAHRRRDRRRSDRRVDLRVHVGHRR